MLKYRRIIFISLGLILIFGLIFFIWNKHKENTILKRALQQQEQMIKQKEEQIQQLQDKLESLRKEQVLREKRIIILKQKREQIQKPGSAEEIIRAFKELGYDAIIK
jgi:predicted  nucleic acid-binding Zn-ribbon protein